MRKHLAIITLLLIAVPAVAHAARPGKGTYAGKAKVTADSSDKTVRIKVLNKSTLNFRGPHEQCGAFNPLKPYYGAISRLRISSSGKFKGDHKYTIRREGSRGSSGGNLDLVLEWHVNVTGRFTSATKATGKVTYQLVHHLEYSNTHKPYVPPGGTTSEEDCGEHTATWTAKKR